ncbi:tetratricopeptide repeat protein [Erythrobacter arachoides]|uniref:Tetratricopeptide repeat protein n=1 Tax=Aurantiacibacter arachoides TaxID=1850444 RepID=A0A844ZWL4_9SPHN|nr:tetratricopeptide repeat protein [Aurantiacibacter arachoides]MXO92493.1 tetratricopeptide repeat protein [Aurantiacibacter arachoides]GGD56728.1 hypothetical protein GCM10011411_15960 [Aurantiacibacter arachoides]
MIRTRPFVLLAALLPLAMTAAPVGAQEVVQALPDPAEADLNDALRRLSRNPNSLPALVDAGRAAMTLGDNAASLGFLNRAQAIDPNDGRVLSALALLAVRRGEAVTAIQLFDNAEAAGVQMGPYAGDRGLAYDLAGQATRAQRYYRQSLSREENNEIVRRLALSYAIAGDAAASETTLLPLLQRQDRAAFRTRAFVLAILGRDEEAISIAETMLPARLSGRLTPYLQYMPRLTPAQQAAAANLGQFPPASQIGRDTPQIAMLEDAPTARPVPASNGDRLTPAGEPLGRGQAVVQNLPTVQETAQPVIQQLPAQQAAVAQAPAQTVELPAIESTEIAASQAPQRPPAMAVPVAQPVANEPAPVVVAVLDEGAQAQAPVAARPSFSLSQPATGPAGAEPATNVEQVEQVELAEAFADFSLASTLPVVPSAGAVDMRTIEPRRDPPPQRAEPQRAEPAAPAPRPAPPPPPAHPSRIWVQVATGQDLAAFRFDWRRLVRASDGALEGRNPFTARWNATSRLLTGPFDSVRAANEFVTRLGEAGISAFRFTSSAGEEVRPLP